MVSMLWENRRSGFSVPLLRSDDDQKSPSSTSSAAYPVVTAAVVPPDLKITLQSCQYSSSKFNVDCPRRRQCFSYRTDIIQWPASEQQSVTMHVTRDQSVMERVDDPAQKSKPVSPTTGQYSKSKFNSTIPGQIMDRNNEEGSLVHDASNPREMLVQTGDGY